MEGYKNEERRKGCHVVVWVVIVTVVCPRRKRGETVQQTKGNASDCFKKQTFDNNGPLATT